MERFIRLAEKLENKSNRCNGLCKKSELMITFGGEIQIQKLKI